MENSIVLMSSFVNNSHYYLKKIKNILLLYIYIHQAYVV